MSKEKISGIGFFEYANVSISIAILIWLMIYPMMLKIDVQSIRDVGKNLKGLFVTWVTNWRIKTFTMFGIVWVFFFVIFKTLIPPELARDYLAGAVLLGAASGFIKNAASAWLATVNKLGKIAMERGAIPF